MNALQTVTPAVEPESSVALFERLARDPNISVEKVEGMMALWERGETRKAQVAFNIALNSAQKAMRPIAADADNPQTKSRYASYAALDRSLRPIYTDHGFGLSFNTGDAPGEAMVRVFCEVTHAAGFSKTYSIDMPADGKGARGGDVMTRTHATGSAVSYGMRYLLKMIFNVAIGSERDDDGNAASRRAPEPKETPKEPAGYADWLASLESAAVISMDKLTEAWEAAPAGCRVHINATDRARWERMKKIASGEVVQ